MGSTFSRGSLTFKQAAATLAVALLLGLLVGGVQAVLDWRSMRAETQSQFTKVLDLVAGSAAEAAYQLHAELSRQLVAGLLVLDGVQRVELRDDFGQVLAVAERAIPADQRHDALGWLFVDVSQYRKILNYAPAGADAAPQAVGTLELQLAPALLAKRFLGRTLREALFDMARAVLISALVVLLLHWMITRPLLRLARAIGEVDPAAPGRWAPPSLRGHRGDELGLLRDRLSQLLADSQRGLDERDRVQRELTELTQALEYRVEERTHALEALLADLAQQKLALEAAFGELEATHQELSKTNGLLVESIGYARRIQTGMLPDPTALGDAVSALQILWDPLHLVGGDWYWLERRGNTCLLLVADCTGHGVPGAFITLVLASALQAILREEGLGDPGRLLLALDRAVRERLRQDRPDVEADDGFAAALLVWERASGTLQFASAGGIPLMRLGADGKTETWRGLRGQLGYQSLPPPAAIHAEPIVVPPGATFYLMTDGVHDQMGGAPRRLLGRRQVARWLAAHHELPLDQQVSGLRAMLTAYRDGESRRDDMTLVAFRPR